MSMDADEAAHQDHRQRQQKLQIVVDGLTATHTGAAPSDVRELLERELHAAGLDVGTEKWLGDTAAEIAAGREVVIDPRRHTA